MKEEPPRQRTDDASKNRKLGNVPRRWWIWGPLLDVWVVGGCGVCVCERGDEEGDAR